MCVPICRQRPLALILPVSLTLSLSRRQDCRVAHRPVLSCPVSLILCDRIRARSSLPKQHHLSYPTNPQSTSAQPLLHCPAVSPILAARPTSTPPPCAPTIDYHARAWLRRCDTTMGMFCKNPHAMSGARAHGKIQRRRTPQCVN